MMNRVKDWLAKEIGLDPDSIGVELVDRAIQRRLSAREISDEGEYLARLHSSEDERQRLIEEAVVPETWFFRDQAPFQYLKTWTQKRPKGSVLRVASVPCSQGEEPYSIAIALLENQYKPSEFHIDGFDISLRALQRAKEAVYRPNSFRHAVPNHDRYFEQNGGSYGLREPYRPLVHFEWGNLLDPTFGENKQPYDVIFCRNLLIYLDAPSRKQVVQTLDRMLAPGGLVFVGAVEALHSITDRFEPIREPLAFVYRRREANPPVQPLPTMAPKTASTVCQSKPMPAKPSTRHVPKAASVIGPFAPTLETIQSLSNRGWLNEARIAAENFILSQTPNAEAYYMYGLVQQALNETQAAEASYQKALFLEPGHEGALAQMALLSQQNGDESSALRFRRRLKRVDASKSDSIETAVLK